MSDLVIGEGVALDLRLAKLASRSLAKMLDLLVQVFGGLILISLVGLALAGSDTAVARGVLIVLAVAIVIGYPVVLETTTRGRSLGKMALGLRVVREDGGPITFRHALVRALMGLFDFFATVGLLAVVTSFCSTRGRRTGDVLAGTVVVRDRVPDAGVGAMGMAALAMPYPLLGWAQAQDLSLVPDDLALAVRQYLTRMHELRPEIAGRMGMELATELTRYVPAPPNTPPWAYLAAVTAERRARQIMKAEAEQRAAWEQAQRMAFAQQAAYAAAGAPQQWGGQPQTPPQQWGAPQPPPGRQHPVPGPVPMPPAPPAAPAPPQPNPFVEPAAPSPSAADQTPDDEGFRPPM